jgi:mannitol/fructose-specific phosphotransferase system IIA component
MQTDKKYNFQNPEIQAKAVELAKTATRPTSYNTPKKMALEIKRKLLEEEILKQGFLEQIKPVLQEITEVMIENAKTPEGVADRKMILKASGVFHIKTPAELEWEAEQEEKARSKFITDQLMQIGRPSLNNLKTIQS